MSYYHYTNGCHLPSIVRFGIIKSSEILSEIHEKFAVWLTKSPEWEVACTVGKVISHDELVRSIEYPVDPIETVTADIDYMKKEIGMCRILISETVPVISWANLKEVGKILDAGYDFIDRDSISMGSPVDKWICSFSPIPKKYWEGIEMFVDNEWVRWDERTYIDDFVELCLSRNGKELSGDEMINGFPKKHLQGELDFINRYENELGKFWEANKHKKGYIEVYVKPDYTPYDCGFRFIEKRIRKPTFKPFGASSTNTYALVHFLWEATYTQYRMAVSYESTTCPEFAY